MGNDITIRQETATDFEEIRNVVRLAFLDMEESDHTEHLLVDRIRRSEAYMPELALVAETADRQIVGHILLSRASVETADGPFPVLAVAPLSVLPACQRQGIGGALLREAHKRAAERGHAAALLLGHEDYYPRFGYRKASEFGIRFPFPVPDACCMAVELRPDGLKGVSGTMCYPAAFFSD